jgi:nucleoside-diphosphate-sugar epimerase
MMRCDGTFPLSNMRIVVLGVTGLLGRAVVACCVACGHETIDALDAVPRRAVGRIAFADWLREQVH